VPLSTESLDAHLIGSDGTVYDFHRENRHGWEGQGRVLGSSPSKPLDLRALEEALQAGEGEAVEFKEFVKLGNQKENEIVETVIALANTRGGTIFVGVNDRCVPIGIEREVVKSFPDSGGDLEKAVQEYIGHLRQKITAQMNRCPVLEVNAVKLNDLNILLIRVPEGDQKIYARRQGNAAFVRRGANNVFPDPDIDIPRMLRQAVGSGANRLGGLQG